MLLDDARCAYVHQMDIKLAAQCLGELGSPARLEIFRILIKAGQAGLKVSEVQHHLGIPASTLSHHLSRLVWCGLVSQTREGRVMRCRIVYDRVGQLLHFLEEDCCAGLETHGEAATSS